MILVGAMKNSDVREVEKRLQPGQVTAAGVIAFDDGDKVIADGRLIRIASATGTTGNLSEESERTRKRIHENVKRPAINGESEFGEIVQIGGRHPRQRLGRPIKLRRSRRFWRWRVLLFSL